MSKAKSSGQKKLIPNLPQSLCEQAEALRGEEPMRAAMLELAAALIETAEHVDSATVQVKGDSLKDWRRECASLLAALARPLAGLDPAISGGQEPVAATEIGPAAERIVARTGRVSQDLNQYLERLRQASNEMMRRASEVGALRRALHVDKSRLADQVRAADSLREQVEEVRRERVNVLEEIDYLQERRRLVQAKPAELENERAQIAEAEAHGADLEIQTNAAREQLASLKGALEDRQELLAGLGPDIDKTKAEIESLDKSEQMQMRRIIERFWTLLQSLEEGSGA